MKNEFKISFCMYAYSGTKYSHRRILLFTNNDDPHASNMALQVMTTLRSHYGIIFGFFHIAPGED